MVRSSVIEISFQKEVRPDGDKTLGHYELEAPGKCGTRRCIPIWRHNGVRRLGSLASKTKNGKREKAKGLQKGAWTGHMRTWEMKMQRGFLQRRQTATWYPTHARVVSVGGIELEEDARVKRVSRRTISGFPQCIAEV